MCRGLAPATRDRRSCRRTQVMFVRHTVLGLMLSIPLTSYAPAQQPPANNLALTSRATASSESEGTSAANLIDGDSSNTRWRAKEGTLPKETWVELVWPREVQFQEVVIRQGGSPKLSPPNREPQDSAGSCTSCSRS